MHALSSPSLPLSLSYWWPQVSWTKCKASNERTVTLSYWKLSGQKTGQSGLWWSRTLPPLNFADTHSEPLVRRKAGGERKKKKGVWIDGDWTWMALSSVLGSMPDYREQVSIFFIYLFFKVVANSHSKVNLCCFVQTLHVRSTIMKNWGELLIKMI